MSRRKQMTAVVSSLVLVGCLSGLLILNTSANGQDKEKEAKAEVTVVSEKTSSVFAKTDEKKDTDKKETEKKEKIAKTEATETKKVDTKSAEQGSSKNQSTSSDQKKADVGKASGSSEQSTKSAAKGEDNGGSDVGNASNSQPSNSGQASNNSQPSNDTKAPEKNKVWVEPVYETKSYPEQGHYETRVVQAEWTEQALTGSVVVCYCGAQFDTTEAAGSHAEAAGRGSGCNGYSVQPVYGSIYHPAVTEQVWIVDSPARSERVLVSEGYWK